MRTVCRAQWICLIHENFLGYFVVFVFFYLYVNPFVSYGCFYRTRSIVRNHYIKAGTTGQVGQVGQVSSCPDHFSGQQLLAELTVVVVYTRLPIQESCLSKH